MTQKKDRTHHRATCASGAGASHIALQHQLAELVHVELAAPVLVVLVEHVHDLLIMWTMATEDNGQRLLNKWAVCLLSERA